MNKLFTILLILFAVNCYSQQYIEFNDSLKAVKLIQKLDKGLGYSNSNAVTYTEPILLENGNYAVIIEKRVIKFLTIIEKVRLTSKIERKELWIEL